MISIESRQQFAGSYIARGLDERQIDEIASMLSEVNFTEGDAIFQQDDDGGDLYIVLEGKAVIRASNGDLMARIKPGGVFGEISLLDQRQRSATVIAESDVVLLRLSSAKLQVALEQGSLTAVRLLRNIAMVVCERLRSANLQIEALLLATGMDI
jgi:CRP/FNR family cyclic AMP-dependent transcriptional regulator